MTEQLQTPDGIIDAFCPECKNKDLDFSNDVVMGYDGFWKCNSCKKDLGETNTLYQKMKEVEN